jgi:hypothetical protein
MAQTPQEEAEKAFQPIFGVQTGALGFNRERVRAGCEVCIVKEAQSQCGLMDHYLSSGSVRVPENCYHCHHWRESNRQLSSVGGWSVLQGSAHSFLGDSFIAHCKDVMGQTCPSWITM